MKKRVISIIACITCLSILLVPCHGFAIIGDIIDVIADTVFSEVNKGMQDLTADVLSQLWEAQFKSPTNNNGSLEITAPTFDIITGKVQLHYDIYDPLSNEISNSDDVLIESTFILAPNGGAYIDENIDIPLFSNGINITITRTSVSPQHYFIRFPNSFNYDRSVTFGGDKIIIAAQSNCTVFKVEKGDRYSDVFDNVSYSNFYVESTTFTTNSVNLTTVSINDKISLTASELNTYSPNPDGIYSYRGSNVSISNRLNYPTTLDLLHGSFTVSYPRLSNPDSSPLGKAFYCFSYFSTGFVITNNSTHSTQVRSNYTEVYEQNYYIYPVTGGTTITENNYNDYNLPSVAPIFDLDPSLPTFDTDLLDLLPMILNALDTDLLPDLADLLARLMGFFEHMPDIGMTWNPDTSLNTNNYWELDFPSDDSGGGGSGGDITVNVDVTRPLVPKVTTNYWLELDVGTQTTITYPVALVSAAPQVFEKADEAVNTLEIMPLIGLLAVFGIAVAILFKGV